MSEVLLSIALFSVPVLAVVLIAVLTGRRLSGSCGGVGPDGRCSRCGKPADEIPAAPDRSGCP